MRGALSVSAVLLFAAPAWSQSTLTAPGVTISAPAANSNATYSVVSRRATVPVTNTAIPAVPLVPTAAPLVPVVVAAPSPPPTPVVAPPAPVVAPPPPPQPAAPAAPPTVSFGGMTWTFAPDGTVIPATQDAPVAPGNAPSQAPLRADDPAAASAVVANQGLTLGGAVPGPRFLFMSMPLVTPQGRFLMPEPPPLAPGALRATITLPAVASAAPSGSEPWVPYPVTTFGLDPLRGSSPTVGPSRESGSGFQVGAGSSEVVQGGFALAPTPSPTLRNPSP